MVTFEEGQLLSRGREVATFEGRGGRQLLSRGRGKGSYFEDLTLILFIHHWLIHLEVFH